MKLKLVLISGISLALALALAGGAGWYAGRTVAASSASAAGPTAQANERSSIQVVNGETVVVVRPATQRASHIEVSPVSVLTERSAVSAYATVIDLQPLYDLHNRRAAARAEVDTLTAQAAASRAQYERSRILFADDRNISQKTLQDARSAMQVDEAKLRSAKAALAGLDATLREQFGNALANAASAPASGLFQRLLSGQASVLRVTLPASAGDAAPAEITVQLPDDKPVSVHKLSASPIADPAVQGSPWLYVAERTLAAGLRTSANAPTSNQTVSGLLIPERAVVWYGGQTWAYVQTSPDRFTRRYVASGDERNQGFVVTSGFRAGDQIVTQGAQLLLSEELKPQGIATTCKDPPECDD